MKLNKLESIPAHVVSKTDGLKWCHFYFHQNRLFSFRRVKGFLHLIMELFRLHEILHSSSYDASSARQRYFGLLDSLDIPR